MRSVRYFISPKYLLAVLLWLVMATAWMNVAASPESNAGGYGNIESVPNPQTADRHNFVSDPAGILGDTARDRINGLLDTLRRDTLAEVAVVMLPSIGDNVIEDYANRLFNYWGIGQRGVNNGLLVLFVLDQHSVRFEVGYGLEGLLPDALCKRIQVQAMIPRFREGDYDRGMIDGVELAVKTIRREPLPHLGDGGGHSPSVAETLPGGVLFLLGWMLLGMWWVAAGSRKNEHKPSVTKAEGYARIKTRRIVVGVCYIFFIPFTMAFVMAVIYKPYLLYVILIPFMFIPIYFYSRVRARRFLRAPFPCKCGGTMRYSPEGKALTPQQLTEIRIRSRRNLDFECDRCHSHQAVSIGYPFQKYKKCPECGAMALKEKAQRIVKRATFSAPGQMEVDSLCLHCSHITTTTSTIPKRALDTVFSSSGGGSSSGGSSSGSFGGGSSGGGGSTSNW